MDGAANTAGVTPREVSYHTGSSLSSVEGPRPRGGAARVPPGGPCAPLRLPGRPARRAPAPTTHPHTPHPTPPVYHPRRLLCVSGGCGRHSTPPCMPSASDWRCGRGLPCRRRRYDGRSPRPAAAVPRRSGPVTPRSLFPRGKGGGIGAGASVEPAAWPPGRLRPGG